MPLFPDLFLRESHFGNAVRLVPDFCIGFGRICCGISVIPYSPATRRLGAMSVHVVHAQQLPGFALVFGALVAPQEGVRQNVSSRPTLHRTGLIVTRKQDATVGFATSHDGCHTLRRIDPHHGPALAFLVVEVDRCAVWLGSFVVRIRRPDLL